MVKGKVLNKATKPAPVEDEDFDFEDHGLDPDIDDLDLDLDDDEPVVEKPKAAKEKAPAKQSKKSKAKEEEADLDLGDLEIDEIEGDDLEALAHADLTTSDLQKGKGQSTSVDVLGPIMDRLSTLEEHMDVGLDNVLNRLKSSGIEVNTIINNQAIQAKELVQIKDMLASVLGRITSVEECFRSFNKLYTPIAKKAEAEEVATESKTKGESKVPKTTKVARPALPEGCKDEHIRAVFTVVNKASGPVDYSKLVAALAKRWADQKAGENVAGLLSHLGYAAGEKLVPGILTYDKYKP